MASKKQPTPTNETIDKEIMALIHFTNGFAEVTDDDDSFDRVYQYIKTRYEQRMIRRLDGETMRFATRLTEALNATVSALERIRVIASGTSEDQLSAIETEIDTALDTVDSALKEKAFSDLNAYKIYKEVMKKAG